MKNKIFYWFLDFMLITAILMTISNFLLIICGYGNMWTVISLVFFAMYFSLEIPDRIDYYQKTNKILYII